MKTSEMTMSNIFTHIKDKYKNDKDTKVFLLASERASNKIRDLDKVSVSAKNLWILVETTKIRTDIRQEIANDFNIRKFYSSSTSVDQIKIDDFIKDTGKYKKIESIRIIFKYPPRFVLSNFKWANKTLESKVKTLGKPDNIYEVNILNQINAKISDMGGSVTLRIKNKNYKDVIGFNAGPGKSKADFEIVNINGDSIGWISYKSGNTSKDFQQYGGITRGAGENIYNHPQVKEFREKIVNDKNIQNQIKKDKKFAFIRIKKSNTLKNRAVFGKEFGRRKGVHNVDWFAQGNLVIRSQGNILNITFSKKLVENGRVHQLNQDYDPVIAARTAESGRNFQRATMSNLQTRQTDEVKGIRGGIFPQGLIEARNSIDMSGF